jgi:hypothetical protein
MNLSLIDSKLFFKYRGIPPPTFSICDGMRTRKRDTQWKSTRGTRVESYESASNFTLERLPQHPKQDSPRVLTGAGIHIDVSETQLPNKPSPRPKTCDPDSNVKPESFIQFAKQYVPRVLTVAGIQINVSDEHNSQMPAPQFRDQWFTAFLKALSQ